jgi:adenylate cyclase
VRYVLEGSVRKAGRHIRVTGQLVEAARGRHIWAEKYDRELTDIFAIQDEITRAVAASVQTQVEMFEGEIATHSRIDVWSLLKRAWRRMLDLDIPALDEARQLAEQALHLDPSNAHAHAVLSVALYQLALMRRGPTAHDEVTQARALAITAIRLNERDEYSHWALGMACHWLGKSERALAAYRRALEINPNFSLAYGVLGGALANDRPEESIEASQLAIRLNPRDPANFFRYSSLATAYYVLGNYEAAIEWARKSVDRKREWFRAHLYLIAALAHSGRLKEARFAVTEYLTIFPNGSICDAAPPHVYSTTESLLLGLRKAGLPE